MRYASLLLLVVMAAVGNSCRQAADDFSPGQIIALERGALDRWGRGDPNGFLELDADEITYFDPTTEKRTDGLPAMRASLAPLTGKIHVDHYEMIGPQVQQHGDVAVLSYNLISYVRPPEGGTLRTVRWNCTEVYARIGGQWKIVHNHWSYTQPRLAEPAGPA